jgi:hypothetical protein
VVHGDTWHNTYQREIAQNQACGHRNLHTVWGQDTMLHRLTEWGVVKEIWEWTRTHTARIQRTDQRRISTDWLFRPCFKTWPRQRLQTILWFLAHMVVYQVNQRRTTSVTEYTDFMRRAWWKTYQCSNRIQSVGNNLELFQNRPKYLAPDDIKMDMECIAVRIIMCSEWFSPARDTGLPLWLYLYTACYLLLMGFLPFPAPRPRVCLSFLCLPLTVVGFLCCIKCNEWMGQYHAHEADKVYC